MKEIPEEFWPLFIEKIRSLAEVYNPVSIPRLYPFIVSHLSSDRVEQILNRASEKGIIAIEWIEFQRGPGNIEKQRMITLK